MDSSQFEELVARWASRDRLAPAEEADLLDWLESHPDARDALLADETLDSLLRSWPRLEETADDFVQGCLHRAAEEQPTRRTPVSAVAAPPVVAPPVAVLSPPKIAVDRSRRRRLDGNLFRGAFKGSIGRWSALAACSAVLLLGLIAWRWLAPGSRPADVNQQVMPLAEGQPARTELEGAFATLVQSASADWETPLTDGDRLAAGVLKLTSGSAELHFDKGSVARLTGPAVLELRSGDEVFLKSGSLTARVPPPAVGFTVATPLSRIVDLGTEFDVNVEDSGTTQTQVRKGRVSLEPQRGDEDLGAPIQLAADDLDRATVSVPDAVGNVLPVAIVARGSQGRFLGRLSAAGKTAEFHSQAAFHAFRVQAMKQLRADPGQFAQKWPSMTAEANGNNGNVAAEPRGKSPPPKVADVNPPADAGGHRHASPGPAADHEYMAPDQTVEVEENGKKVSITDSKESGITVTITESQDGKKKTTKVRAANSAELALKNPEAHRFYRQYYHARPKGGKSK